VALTDISIRIFTRGRFEMLRQLYKDGELSRKEFLDYLPAHIPHSMIDSHGYLSPANPAPFEIPEPIESRFEILEL